MRYNKMQAAVPILTSRQASALFNVDSKVRNFMQPLRYGRDALMYGGLHQDSDIFRELKIQSTRDLEKHIVPESVYLSSVLQGLSDWSVYAFPVSYPIEDNSEFRKELQLQEPTTRHKEIATWLIKYCLQEGDYRPVRINRKSQSGYPFFTNNTEYSVSAITKAFKNFGHLLSLINTGAYRDLLNEYDALPIASSGYRAQAEKISGSLLDNDIRFKKRKYPNANYLGYKHVENGETTVNNTVVDKNGKKWPELVASRFRDIYAFNRILNLTISGVLNNYMYAAWSKLGIAQWHGPEEMTNEIKTFLRGRKGYFCSLDKGNFDKTMHHYYFDIFDVIVAEQVSPEIAKAHAILRNAPTLFKNPDGIGEPLITYEFSDTELIKQSWNKKQLKSGLGTVSIDGKIIGAVDMLVNLEKLYKGSFNLEKALSNTDLRYRSWIFGDDAMLVFINESDRDEFVKIVDNNKVHNDETSTQGEYLGYKFSSNGDSFRDAGRLIEALLGSERGFGQKDYPEIGLLARMVEYKKNPFYDEIMHIVSSNYKRIGVDLNEIMNAGFAKLKESNYSYEELIFLNDPSVIQWKYDVGSIKKELILEEFGEVSLDLVVEAWTSNSYLEWKKEI